MTARVIVSVTGFAGGSSSRGGKPAGSPPQAESKKIMPANPKYKIIRNTAPS